MLRTLALLAATASSGLAAVFEKEWNVEWVSASPDGFTRPVIGVNGEWPCPTLDVDVGDKVIIHVTNRLENQTTALHWHGILQEGNTLMDGPAHATQCPIPPGMSFTYEFEAKHPGTYWYHAHVGAQYSDGLRAPLIVHDKNNPHGDDIEDEYILTVSDWYHDQSPNILHDLFDISNVNVRPSLPDACLVNDAKYDHYEIRPGKKYKFRIINMSALSGAVIFFDSHDLTVVEIDGIYTERTEADQIYVTAGQRYSVIVEGKEAAEENYAVNIVMDMNPEQLTPIPQIGFPSNGTAFLQYDDSKTDPDPTVVDKFDVLDDLTLKPLDGMKLLENPDQQIQLDFYLGHDDEGIPRAFFNNVSYVFQSTPSLYTALTVGKDALDPEVYGQVNPFIIKSGEVIEITLNNLSPGHHPFHLHGHHFQVLSREPIEAGLAEPCEEGFPAIPMRRDTVGVHGLSSAIIRFKADNPGVWLFHCHIEWHLPLGMVATFIEDPLALQKAIPKIPKQHLEICQAQGIGTGGNAAGNRDDHFDLNGAVSSDYVPNDGAMYKGERETRSRDKLDEDRNGSKVGGSRPVLDWDDGSGRACH